MKQLARAIKDLANVIDLDKDKKAVKIKELKDQLSGKNKTIKGPESSLKRQDSTLTNLESAGKSTNEILGEIAKVLANNIIPRVSPQSPLLQTLKTAVESSSTILPQSLATVCKDSVVQLNQSLDHLPNLATQQKSNERTVNLTKQIDKLQGKVTDLVHQNSFLQGTLELDRKKFAEEKSQLLADKQQIATRENELANQLQSTKARLQQAEKNLEDSGEQPDKSAQQPNDQLKKNLKILTVMLKNKTAECKNLSERNENLERQLNNLAGGLDLDLTLNETIIEQTSDDNNSARDKDIAAPLDTNPAKGMNCFIIQ